MAMLQLTSGTPVTFSYTKPGENPTRRSGTVEACTVHSLIINTDDGRIKQFNWSKISKLKY